jgi:hypothetical protein
MKNLKSILLSILLASFISTGVYAADEQSTNMNDKAQKESVQPMDESTAKPMDESYTERAKPAEEFKTEKQMDKSYSEKAAPREDAKAEKDAAFSEKSMEKKESVSTSEKHMDQAVDTEKWIGKDVKTHEGEKVGTLKEVVRDSDGKISLVVISHGGFLGIGEDKVAVPFTLLTFNEAEEFLVIDVTEDQLAGAPKIEGDINLQDRAYAEEVYRHFGERTYWTEEKAASDTVKSTEKRFEGDTMKKEDMKSEESRGYYMDDKGAATKPETEERTEKSFESDTMKEDMGREESRGYYEDDRGAASESDAEWSFEGESDTGAGAENMERSESSGMNKNL